MHQPLFPTARDEVIILINMLLTESGGYLRIFEILKNKDAEKPVDITWTTTHKLTDIPHAEFSMVNALHTISDGLGIYV